MKRAVDTSVRSVVMACLTFSAVSAQETVTKERVNARNRLPNAGKLDAKNRRANLRVSQLIGHNLQNSQGERVGDIDADDYVLILDVTEQQLEGQEGFDEDNWPDMADRKWRAELNERYRVKRNLYAKDRLRRANR